MWTWKYIKKKKRLSKCVTDIYLRVLRNFKRFPIAARKQAEKNNNRIISDMTVMKTALFSLDGSRS